MGLDMESFRINEMLSEQIAFIQEYATKLDTSDLHRLEENLTMIESAVRKLKEQTQYLPK